MDQHVLRELSLAVDNRGGTIGEFVVELEYDRPGILAALSNVFADNDINIINITMHAVDRQKIHFLVDVSGLGEDDLRNVARTIRMFAFVRDVDYRTSTGRIVVPGMVGHVFLGRNVVVVDRDLLGKLGPPGEVAAEMARNDAAAVKRIVNGPLGLREVAEALNMVQLRGIGTVRESRIGEDTANILVCGDPAMARRYVQTLLAELAPSLSPELVDEGMCVRVLIGR